MRGQLAGTAAVLAGLLVQRAVRFLLLGTSSSERERYVTTKHAILRKETNQTQGPIYLPQV
jgi:hypothetical protein